MHTFILITESHLIIPVKCTKFISLTNENRYMMRYNANIFKPWEDVPLIDYNETKQCFMFTFHPNNLGNYQYKIF